MESRSQVLSGALSPKVAFVLRHTAMRAIESYGTPVDGLMAWAGLDNVVLRSGDKQARFDWLLVKDKPFEMSSLLPPFVPTIRWLPWDTWNTCSIVTTRSEPQCDAYHIVSQCSDGNCKSGRRERFRLKYASAHGLFAQTRLAFTS
jgi:hypothetical protein